MIECVQRLGLLFFRLDAIDANPEIPWPKKYSDPLMVGERMVINPMGSNRKFKKKKHKKKHQSKKVVIPGSVILGHLPKPKGFLDLVEEGIWEWSKIGGWKTTFEVWLQNDISTNLCGTHRMEVPVLTHYCASLWKVVCLVKGAWEFPEIDRIKIYPDIQIHHGRAVPARLVTWKKCYHPLKFHLTPWSFTFSKSGTVHMKVLGLPTYTPWN